jgi:hypothetical protein
LFPKRFFLWKTLDIASPVRYNGTEMREEPMPTEKNFDENWTMPDDHVYVPNPNAILEDMDEDDVEAVIADIKARRGVE